MVIAAGAAGLIKTALALHRRAAAAVAPLRRAEPGDRLRAHAVPGATRARRVARAAPARGARASAPSASAAPTRTSVLEEAPPPMPSTPSPRGAQLLLLSARTAPALDERVHQPGRHPVDAPAHRSPTSPTRCASAARLRAPPLWSRRPARGDAARTLRHAAIRPQRRAAGRRGAAEPRLHVPGPGRAVRRHGPRPVRSEPAFRAAFDECCAIVDGAYRRRSARASSSRTIRKRWSPTSADPAGDLRARVRAGATVDELGRRADGADRPQRRRVRLRRAGRRDAARRCARPGRRARRAACRRCPPAHAVGAAGRRRAACRGCPTASCSPPRTRPALCVAPARATLIEALDGDARRRRRRRRAPLADLARLPLADDGPGRRALRGRSARR